MEFVILSSMICFEDLVLSVRYIDKRCLNLCRVIIPRLFNEKIQYKGKCLYCSWYYTEQCMTCHKYKTTRSDPFGLVQGFHCTSCYKTMETMNLKTEVLQLLPRKYIGILDYVRVPSFNFGGFSYLYSKKQVMSILELVLNVDERRDKYKQKRNNQYKKCKNNVNTIITNKERYKIINKNKEEAMKK